MAPTQLPVWPVARAAIALSGLNFSLITTPFSRLLTNPEGRYVKKAYLILIKENYSYFYCLNYNLYNYA
jgi:hypothetical protein